MNGFRQKITLINFFNNEICSYSVTRLAIVIVLILLIVSISASASGQQVKMVEGIIENVSDGQVRVRGKYFRISDVPLKDSSENIVSVQELIIGRKIVIYFYKDKITSVYIQNKNIVE